MKKKLTKARIVQYFKAYPKLNRMWFTSDGSGFADRALALEVAALKGESPREVTREDLSKEGDSLPGKKIELVDPNDSVKAELLAFDLNEDCDWAQIQKLGKAFDVDAKSKVEYIAALTPIKAALIPKED